MIVVHYGGKQNARKIPGVLLRSAVDHGVFA